MRLDALDRPRGAGPLDRLDPKVKILATLGYLATLVAIPLTWWGLMVAEAVVLAVVIAISRLEIAPLLRRWLAFAPLVAFLGVMVGLGHPARGSLGLGGVSGAIVAKNSLAFLSVMVLAGVTPVPELLGGMRRLGAPAVLIATLHFMARYLHVLGDELARMVQARRSRSFRRGSLDWGLLTGLIGVLFLRAMERGERVHSAMIARGWDGTIRSLDERA
jgi:cobalt/nickel transport system permease protein